MSQLVDLKQWPSVLEQLAQAYKPVCSQAAASARMIGVFNIRSNDVRCRSISVRFLFNAVATAILRFIGSPRLSNMDEKLQNIFDGLPPKPPRLRREPYSELIHGNAPAWLDLS
jgi:hypothetical protein